MADPRSIVEFDEIDAGTATFDIDGTTVTYDPSHYDLGSMSAQNGMAVTLVSDSTIGLGSSGNFILGKVTRVNGDLKASVQHRGFMKLPYLVGTPPTVGRGVVVDGAGNVTTTGGSRVATERGIVVSLDSTNLLASVYLW